MNKVYAKKSQIKADFWLDFPIPSTITVFEDVYEPMETGILDPDGEPIVSYYVKEPIGFIHWEE